MGSTPLDQSLSLFFVSSAIGALLLMFSESFSVVYPQFKLTRESSGAHVFVSDNSIFFCFLSVQSQALHITRHPQFVKLTVNIVYLDIAKSAIFVTIRIICVQY